MMLRDSRCQVISFPPFSPAREWTPWTRRINERWSTERCQQYFVVKTTKWRRKIGSQQAWAEIYFFLCAQLSGLAKNDTGTWEGVKQASKKNQKQLAKRSWTKQRAVTHPCRRRIGWFKPLASKDPHVRWRVYVWADVQNCVSSVMLNGCRQNIRALVWENMTFKRQQHGHRAKWTLRIVAGRNGQAQLSLTPSPQTIWFCLPLHSHLYFIFHTLVVCSMSLTRSLIQWTYGAKFFLCVYLYLFLYLIWTTSNKKK